MKKDYISLQYRLEVGENIGYRPERAISLGEALNNLESTVQKLKKGLELTKEKGIETRISQNNREVYVFLYGQPKELKDILPKFFTEVGLPVWIEVKGDYWWIVEGVLREYFPEEFKKYSTKTAKFFRGLEGALG